MTGKDLDPSLSELMEGLARLTPREHQVLVEFLRDRNTKKIARKLATKEHTVRNQLDTIRKKLGCSSRVELAINAVRLENHLNRPPES